ncbi:MAG: hypothetical protein ACK5RA_03260 [Cyanobacteriota bacterium]|jgi:hypothetical protein
MELTLSLAVAALVAPLVAVGLSYMTILLETSIKKMIIYHLKVHAPNNDPS